MSAYKIFTTKHDRTVSAGQLLSEKLTKFDSLAGDDKRWLASIEKHMREANGTINIEDIGEGKPLSILIEMGGSMRGSTILAAIAAVEKIGDALDAAGRDFSILGNTTSQWKGGLSRKDWNQAGRKFGPGRLNDILHITFKSFHDSWVSKRADLKLAFMDGILKENIDGEALEWVRNEQVVAGLQGNILHISDGPSMDDSTLSINPSGFLKEHRDAVIEQIRAENIDYKVINAETTLPYDRRTFEDIPDRCTAVVEQLCESILAFDAEMIEMPSPD